MMSVPRKCWFGIFGLAVSTLLGSATGALESEITKGYVTTEFGQVHYRQAGYESSDKPVPKILLFHPNPYSGLYFETVLPFLGRQSTAIALDTPGYGGSSKPQRPLLMAEIAQRMGAAIDELEVTDGDLVVAAGYHTGAFIASELALLRPDLVDAVILIGVPYWNDERREENRTRLLKDIPIPQDGSHLPEKWDFSVTNRNPVVPIGRAHALFAESLRPGRDVWWAYHAVVNYRADLRFPEISQPVLVLNTHGSLEEETRAIVPLLADVTLVEVPELSRGIFEEGPDLISDHITQFVSGLQAPSAGVGSSPE